MKLNILKFYLTGAGSTLEIFPNSDPDDELHRICEITQRYDELLAGVSFNRELVGLTATCEAYPVHIQHFTPAQSDRDSLLDDWRSVGSDLLVATQRARNNMVRPQKDESECWSS